MRTYTDVLYSQLVGNALLRGQRVETRNSKALRLFAPYPQDIQSLPLVTLRKTAWKKALREMEWFMSGHGECPPELQDWWKGQLVEDHDEPVLNGHYIHGYPHQFRYSPTSDGGAHDQVRYVLEALKGSPYSRRIILTSWNPGDMACISQTNENPNTPTTCHATMVQYSVDAGADGKPAVLNAYHFQRSADLLLGLPHNYVQHWALLTFFAHHAGLKVGQMTYQVGDAHLYDEPSHIAVALELSRWEEQGMRYDDYTGPSDGPTLVYNYSGQLDHRGLPKFVAADFSVDWRGMEPSKPLTDIRPKLL